MDQTTQKLYSREYANYDLLSQEEKRARARKRIEQRENKAKRSSIHKRKISRRNDSFAIAKKAIAASFVAIVFALVFITAFALPYVEAARANVDGIEKADTAENSNTTYDNASVATENNIATANAAKTTQFDGITANDLVAMDRDTRLAKIKEMAKAEMNETGLLASVTAAQLILESGWAESQLAIQGNNLFGIKGDGIVFNTAEYDSSGNRYTVEASFRKYDDVWSSIEDRSNILMTSTDGNGKLLYAGMVGNADPQSCVDILASGGWATSPQYATELMDIITCYNLTELDL